MTFGTELKLLLIWLFAAEVAAVVLTAILVVRKPPEPHGFWRSAARYFLLSSAIASCLPVLLLVLRVVKSLADVFVTITPTIAEYWWTVPVALAVAAGAFVAWWFWPRGESVELEPAAAGFKSIAADVNVAPAQPAMWSLPAEHRGGGL